MAGSASGIRAGAAFVELGIKDSALVKGLKGAETRLKGLGASVAGVGAKLGAAGAAITAPFLGAAKTFADSGAALALMSSRTGASVESLSALGFAASQTGTDMESVEIGLKKMQKLLAAAAGGNAEAIVAFNGLGLSIQGLARLKPEDQFAAIAKALDRVRDPTLRSAAAIQIFGRSGTALLPLAGNLEALTQEARDLGLVTSNETAESALRLKNAFTVVSAVLKKITTTIGGALAPVLTEAAGAFARIAKGALDWARANKPLFVTLFKIGAALAVAGAAIAAFGGAIAAAGTVLGTIATAIAAVGTGIGLLLSPIALVVAAVVGAGVAFFRFTDLGGKALAWLGEQFAGLRADATAAFAGIADALKAGDLKLAGAILWGFLRVEFLKGINYLKSLWSDFAVATVTTFKGVSFNIASVLTDAWAGIKTGFVNGIGFIETAWANLIAFLKTSFNVFGGELSAVWAKIKATLTGKDAKAAVEKIWADVAASNAAVVAGAAGGRGGGRQQQLGQIEAERRAAQQDITRQEQAALAARKRAAAEGLAPGETALAQAQGDLAALEKVAEMKAAAVKPLVDIKKPGFDPGELDNGLRQIERKTESKGTFSAAGLRGLGTGDTLSEIAREQLKAREELEKLNRKAALGRLVFNQP